MNSERWPSQDHDCPEMEADVLAAMDDTDEEGCPICGLAPEEHPPTLEASNTEVLGEAVEAIAEILCAWDYRDDSGKTWPTLSDIGRDSFRIQAAQLLEGAMPGRDHSAAAIIRSQEGQRVLDEVEKRFVDGDLPERIEIAVRHNERQQVRRRMEKPIHDLATHIGRARIEIHELDDPPALVAAKAELQDASDAMKALRSALALDSLEEDND